MRVIAGAAKGRRLSAPTWDGLRPTSDRLRETLFNILAPRLDGARLLDGYAGTGALGIEGLSRGAAHATFVEQDPRAVKLIGVNLDRAGMKTAANACTIVRAGFIEMARSYQGPPFDLVLLDPPYDEPALGEAVQAAAEILGDDGLIVLEHATRAAAPEVAQAFRPEVAQGFSPAIQLVRTVRAGDSSLSFYAKNG